MSKNGNGNGNGNGGGFNLGAVLGIVSLIIALDIPMFTWIQSNASKVDKLAEEMATHAHENVRDDLRQAQRQGEVDQLIKDRGDVIEKLGVSLQRQLTDGIAITDAKLSGLDVRLQSELKVKDENLQSQINDAMGRVEQIRQKKIQDERELSELQQQVRALERETFRGQLAPLSK